MKLDVLLHKQIDVNAIHFGGAIFEACVKHIKGLVGLLLLQVSSFSYQADLRSAVKIQFEPFMRSKFCHLYLNFIYVMTVPFCIVE